MPLEISEIGVRMDVTEEKSDSSKKTQETCEQGCEKPHAHTTDEEDSVMPAQPR